MAAPCHITDHGKLKDSSVVTGVNPVAFPVLGSLGKRGSWVVGILRRKTGRSQPKSVVEWFDSGTNQNMVGRSVSLTRLHSGSKTMCSLGCLARFRRKIDRSCAYPQREAWKTPRLDHDTAGRGTAGAHGSWANLLAITARFSCKRAVINVLGGTGYMMPGRSEGPNAPSLYRPKKPGEQKLLPAGFLRAFARTRTVR